MSAERNMPGARSDAANVNVSAGWFESGKTFTVILDSLDGGVETPDSFAIKFSLLTRTPVTKVKHTIRRLPARIWSGEGRGRAERILAYIQEAGGNGRVIEGGARPAPSAGLAEDRAAALRENAAKGPPAVAEREQAPKDRSACAYCGFPLGEGDRYCGFCRTPVGAVPAPGDPELAAAAGKTAGLFARRIAGIPAPRLVVYAAVLVAGVIVLMALR